MPKRWCEISARHEGWTPATWLVFLGLFALYGACLWFATGWGPGWLEMVRTCFRALLGPIPSDRAAMIVLCIGTLVAVLPAVVALVPTLLTLLWIMDRANRSEKPAQNGGETDSTQLASRGRRRL
jgi:hypothetical protein